MSSGTSRHLRWEGAGGATAHLLFLERQGARIDRHSKFFPSLLSFESVFPGVVDSLVQEKLMTAKDQYSKHSPSRRESTPVEEHTYA